MELIILITSQMLFSLTRTLNIRYVSEKNIKLVIMTGIIIKITWLISSAIGINSVINENWTNASIYIITGLFGDYLGMKIKL